MDANIVRIVMTGVAILAFRLPFEKGLLVIPLTIEILGTIER
jgi:hypothetical protein